MNVLNELREEFNISYDCNYFKGIRISYGKENKFFYLNRAEVYIYSYDTEDKYRIISKGASKYTLERDFNKSSKGARKEIETIIRTELYPQNIKDIILSFIDDFYEDKHSCNKIDKRDDLIIEYSEDGEFNDDIILLSDFSKFSEEKIGKSIVLSDCMRIKEGDIEVSILPTRSTSFVDYSLFSARDLGFYLIIKEKGEILFRPYCHFLCEKSSLGHRNRAPLGYVPQYHESEFIKKVIPDSDIETYEDFLGLLEDSLEKYPKVHKCITEIFSCIIRNPEMQIIRWIKELENVLEDYKDIFEWYNEKDWYAEEEIDFLIMLNKNKGGK